MLAQCPMRDLNSHAPKGTATSRLRVCRSANRTCCIVQRWTYVAAALTLT